MKIKIKEIGSEILAVAIVALGIGFVTLYVVEALSFLSLFVGIVGYIILRPAIEFYKKEIQKFFE